MIDSRTVSSYLSPLPGFQEASSDAAWIPAFWRIAILSPVAVALIFFLKNQPSAAAVIQPEKLHQP